MDFSLFYFADAATSRRDPYRLLIEGARFADEHGLSAVWTPERHFHSFGGLYPNPAVTGAAIAAITLSLGAQTRETYKARLSPVPADARERDHCQYDLGQATMSIMIAAADLGIGSGHAAVGDQQLARQLLGFPDGKFLAYMIALGYPAGRRLAPIQRPDRRPFDEVVHRGRW